MQSRPTYCRICEAACGLLADVEGDRLVALRPDPDHVVSRGFVCAKGTRFSEVHASPERVDRPLMRVDGRLVETSWERAIADAGSRIAKIRAAHGPHSIGVYMGNPTAFGYAPPLFSLGFVRALGTRNYFSAASLDCNNKFVVARRVLGSAMTHPVPDLDRARFALLLGTNPSVSQSSFVHAPRMIERLQAIVRRGGRVIVIDPRRTETARSVGEWVPIRPDTDAALLLAILNVIFSEGLEDRKTLEKHASGWEDLLAALASFTPERVSTLTRVAPEKIRDIARAFASADGAFCHVSTGVNQGTFGNIAYAAKIALELVTGNLDRAGGALLPKGAVDSATLARRFGFDREPRHRSRIGGFTPVVSTMPTGILADEILTPGDGRIRAMVVISGNPVLSGPGGERLRKAFANLELLVSLDLFVNDSAADATHVLPCTDFLERDDLPLPMLQLMPQPYLQWTDAVVPPRGERRPEWRILADLARAARVPLFGSRAADLAIRATLALGGSKAFLASLLAPTLGPRILARLRDNPHGILVDREEPGDFLKRRIGTRSKKVELFPPDVWARLPELRATLDVRLPERPEGVSLKLITKRERLGHNSWMHANPRLSTPEHAAYLSTADAARLGVANGGRVRLESASGAIELPVVVTDDMVEGAVSVPHGYGHVAGTSWQSAVGRGGQNVNTLAASGPDSVDPLSGMTRYVGVEVRVSAVNAAQTAAE